MKPKILAFAGSLRSGSLNKLLLSEAVRGAEGSGAEVKLVDLVNFLMPLYNADDEAAGGLPEAAKRFKRLMVESDGFLIASPEYNSSVTGVMKNTIDWVSRKEEGDAEPLIAFKGKVALVMSASPGQFGGVRSLMQLRSILSNIGVLVMADQLCLPKAHEAFDKEGRLKDEAKRKRAHGLGAKLTDLLIKLQSD